MTADDNISTEFSPKNDTIDKDQRRYLLLNDVNYGIILCFLEKFRSVLDLPNYSLQRLEDHLINYQERSLVPPRLIDFHFVLLKRLSLAKNTQREKFDSIITKFASRFDLNDSDHLSTTGYLHADVNIKIRILKNLFESQFDLNQTFKNTLIDKPAREIKSTPLGRDRFGVSYWLFMDADCFVRLFREDADIDRTWSNVAKDRDEFENFIKLLITDLAVRNKFSDWTIDYEPFSALSPSDEFEKCYLPSIIDMKEEEMELTFNEDEKRAEPIIKKKRGRAKVSVKSINSEKHQIEMEIKQEDSDPQSTDDENVEVSIKRKRGRPRGSIASVKKEKKQIDIVIKQEEEIVEPTSYDEEKSDEPAKKKRGRPRGSVKSLNKEKHHGNVEIKEEKQEVKLISDHNETTDVLTKKKPGRPRSLTKPIDVSVKQEEEIESTPVVEEKLNESMKKKRGRPRGSVKSLNTTKNKHELKIKDEPKEETIVPARRGRKRKILVEENSNDEDEDSKIEDNDKQNEESSVENGNLSTRRSSRPRKVPTTESTFVDSKTTSQAKKKRSMNGKTKASNDNSTNNKSGRSRRRRKTASRRNINDEFCFSSSSSDEHIDYLSDDEYNSDDYLPNPSEIEHDKNFFELDEDNNTTGEELRTAKTAQASTIITACKVCLKSDRPEVLLLCDDCDDAYHIQCLRPRLLAVPDGDWYCPLCEHKKLSNHLIGKLKELLINFNMIETKRLEYISKKLSLERKIKTKEYTSDESITASESEHDNLENNLNGDESMLSINQTNENSNVSSSFIDDSNKNISQRGRHRRTRFDMNKMLNNDDDDDDDDADHDHDHDGDDNDESDSDTEDDDDDEYVENTTQITNFDLQIPKKMTRLLNPRNRPLTRNDQRFKPKPIAPRLYPSSTDLYRKNTSSIMYSNGDTNSYQIKPIIANSNQTIKIVRRWNDVQRRNKIRINNMKSMNETTSDCADENSVFCPDDASPPRSNESHTNSDMKEEEACTIIRSKITLVQPANLLPIYKSSTKNIVTKNEVNFDRLTRDIQYAVSEANTLSAMPKPIDQQNVKRIQKTNFSPYLTKVSVRPLPVLLPKPAGIGYKIFKSKDPPTSTMTNADLSNIILTPSSSSSLFDGNDEQSTSTMNT